MRQATTARARFAVAAAVLAATAVLAVLLLQGSDAGAKAAAPKWKQAAEQSLLRLGDLGPGHSFLVFSEEGSNRRPPKIICGRPDPADQEPKLKAFLDRQPIWGCFTTYMRLFPLGDSPAYHVVGTAAVHTGNPTIATAGLAVTPQLLSHLFSDETPKKAPAPGTVGDESRLLHVSDFPIFGDEHPNASILAWRSGDVLALVFVQGGTVEANDQEAFELALLQQKRIENPTPYTRAERYDAEAGFHNPAIQVPIYWLGRVLRPGGSLPPAKLEGAAGAPTLGDELPGEKLKVVYSQDLELRSWTADSWKRFRATRPGKRLIDWHCTESRKVQLADGTATLYAAYTRDFKTCPKTAPSRRFAIAKLGETVVAVNFHLCDLCRPVDNSSRYSSPAGLRAALKALRPWPQPAP